MTIRSFVRITDDSFPFIGNITPTIVGAPNLPHTHFIVGKELVL
jgi:hypothetical protein